MAIAKIKNPNSETKIMFSGENSILSITDDLVREKELESLRSRIDSQYDLMFKRIASVECDIYGIIEENKTVYTKIEELEAKIDEEIPEIIDEIARQKAVIMHLNTDSMILTESVEILKFRLILVLVAVIVLALLFGGFIISSLM